MSADRWLIVIVTAVAGLAVAAVLTSELGAGPADLDPASPEGVVQRYLSAFEDGDADAAGALVDPDVREDCPEPHPERFRRDRSFRATLLEVEPAGDAVEVHVRISEGAGEPPFETGSERTEVFVLEQVDGDWRITSAPFPYDPCLR